MILRREILAAAVLTALIAGAAQACPNHSVKTAAVITPPASHATVVAWKPRAWAPTAANASLAQGLRVAIDPVDGTMSMPGPDAFTNDVRIEDDAPVATFRRDNGSTRATLDARFEEFAVVSLGTDGKPSWTCVRGPQGAAQFMKNGAKPAAKSAAPPPGLQWEVK